MEIWKAGVDAYGRVQIERLDAGYAEPEGIACWLADRGANYILFFAELTSPDV